MFDRVAMATYRDAALSQGDVTLWLRDDATGLLTNEVQNGATLARSYDSLGRPTGYTLRASATPREVSFSYDLLGRLATVSSGTNLFTYSYLLGTDLVSGYTCGGFSRSVAYEPYRDLVSAITNRFGSRVISTFEYTNDAAGRRTAIKRGGDAMGPLSGVTDAYGYNVRNEVVSARRTLGGSPVAGFDEDFAYDPIGNRVSSTDYDETGAARTSTYTANNLNQYTARTVPGWASVRGLADADATVAVNGNPAYMVGRAVPSAPNFDELAYFFGSDDFDNSIGGGFAELEVSAVVSDGTNDFVSVATNRVFVPPANETYAYDADGNQTLVTTATGAWQVEYNGENRPVRWTCGDKTLLMDYDHMGRRRLYVEVAAGVTNKLHRFTYDDYVCIDRNREVDAQHGVGSDALVWDSTEPIATRPLMCAPSTETPFFYCHDGNKNVSETVSLYGTIAAHYEYSSFGKVVLVTSENESQATANLNPYRFSSEYADDALGLVYYNWRHYNPNVGRWTSRDPREDIENLIRFINNSPVVYYDFCGLSCSKINGIGAELSASGSLYAGIGGSVSVSLSSTVYNCCCDGKIYQSDAYDVSLTLRGSIGFGVGGRINLPIMGSVGMEVLGPQYAVSGGISYSKDCGEADPEFSVTLVDVSGEIGGSFNVGSMFGASISYWTKYSLSVVAIVHGRSVDFSVNRGWHGGGSSTIYTPAGNINIEFSLYDYQSPLCKDNNIMTLTW